MVPPSASTYDLKSMAENRVFWRNGPASGGRRMVDPVKSVDPSVSLITMHDGHFMSRGMGVSKESQQFGSAGALPLELRRHGRP